MKLEKPFMAYLLQQMLDIILLLINYFHLQQLQMMEHYIKIMIPLILIQRLLLVVEIFLQQLKKLNGVLLLMLKLTMLERNMK